MQYNGCIWTGVFVMQTACLQRYHDIRIRTRIWLANSRCHILPLFPPLFFRRETFWASILRSDELRMRAYRWYFSNWFNRQHSQFCALVVRIPLQTARWLTAWRSAGCAHYIIKTITLILQMGYIDLLLKKKMICYPPLCYRCWNNVAHLFYEISWVKIPPYCTWHTEFSRLHSRHPYRPHHNSYLGCGYWKKFVSLFLVKYHL